MDRSKFLWGLCTPEFCHRTLSSAERLMGVLGPIIEPAAGFMVLLDGVYSHSSPIRSKAIRNNLLRVPVSLHHSPQESECGLSIPFLCDIRFQDFTLMIDSSPKVSGFAIYSHEYLVQMPSPLRNFLHRLRPILSDFGSE